MFKSNCIEAKSGILIIEDMGSTAMQKLLEFMYSGWMDLCGCEAEVIAELMIAAEKVGNGLSRL
jgi:protein tyrosine phosphatase